MNGEGFWRGSELSAERHLVALLISFELNGEFARLCDGDSLLGLVAWSLGNVFCANMLA